MEIFRNKETGEIFGKISETSEAMSLLSLHKEYVTEIRSDDFSKYEKVNLTSEPTNLKWVYSSERDLTIDEIIDCLSNNFDAFRVKDTLCIPVKGYEHPIPFEIVHVDSSTRSIYLMPKDILAMLPMAETASWLKEFENKLHWDLRKVLKPMEHINSSGAHTGLIMLPSIKNMGVAENSCTGKDDITFDAFMDEASRSKNFKDETQWYWTDTPNANSSSRFWYVNSTGGCNDYSASVSYGVCPCFKLSGDEPEDEDDWLF